MISLTSKIHSNQNFTGNYHHKLPALIYCIALHIYCTRGIKRSLIFYKFCTYSPFKAKHFSQRSCYFVFHHLLFKLHLSMGDDLFVCDYFFSAIRFPYLWGENPKAANNVRNGQFLINLQYEIER